ncbi:MAG TPA: condensation domain-containing protein, partial [Thermoanaerobaculia bacterium]|nr:condensation domain-containing protein [Thermoanaerobaculia bacterium]
ESTTIAATCRIAPPPGGGALAAPLGRPIANTRVVLVERSGSPVPIGVAGELAIGGDGLARCYSGRPALTAERFIPDPCCGRHGVPPGSRLYRSGDLARYLADGRIDFLGRVDDQVKLRGFRIEPAEIEAALATHPAVRDCAVMARADDAGERRLVAYVVQAPGWQPAAVGAQVDQVARWEMVFDDVYGGEQAAAAPGDPAFNIVGWESTYTGQPLPPDEMRAWLEDTVERIQGLAPRRVLEIGCGTGMLLLRLAPAAELYWGTDVSRGALAYVDRQLARIEEKGPALRDRVRLLHGAADPLSGVPPGGFDTVVLNSVAQYFPSAAYLAEVVERAVTALAPGGAIFLGDLRSLPLLTAFHTSVELHQAPPELPARHLLQRVQLRRLQENELVVDPAFFAALQRRLPAIARIEVYLKRGAMHNELTGYRYQVVLRVGDAAAPPDPSPGTPIDWLDWQAEGLRLEALGDRLRRERPARLALRGLPNARVAAAAAAARLLFSDEPPATAGEIHGLAAAAARDAVDPHRLAELAREHGYEIELGWAWPGAEGRFEALLLQREAAAGTAARVRLEGVVAADPLAGASRLAPQPLERYTNDPLLGRFARELAPELRAHLGRTLPDYMVPAVFVPLEELPLTAHGKLDRRRLPQPEARPRTASSHQAPRSATEARLAEIWAAVLGLEQVGADAHFFALGGHSLLATQVVSRVREALGVELPLRVLFEAPVIEQLAARIEELRAAAAPAVARPPLARAPRGGRLPLSFAQERLWFLYRLDPRAASYNEAAGFLLDGALDVAALRGGLRSVAARHEVLRTTFADTPEGAAQTLSPLPRFDLPLVDLSGLPEVAADREARRLERRQAQRSFDLETGPLVRALLLRFAPQRHAALFAFHHIVFDGWSAPIFAAELSALYTMPASGLPALPLQYADFAVWQRGWLAGEVLAGEIAWWRERLAGARTLELAGDRPRGAASGGSSGYREAALDPGVATALR